MNWCQGFSISVPIIAGRISCNTCMKKTVLTGKSRKNINISKDDITRIELFAGAGGLALGLEEAGIKGLLFNEIDTTCCDTLRTNRPDWNVQCQDIHTMDFSEYRGKVDLVSG